MTEDAQLLRRYVEEGSEQAFGELVQHYLNLVYSAAYRQVGGDAQLAQDVSQAVFTALARKARSLPEGVVLGGWIYRHTCFVARQTVRTECRRQLREQVAAQMNALNQANEPAWEYLAPFLDEAMQQLRPRDRDAIVLRYFERREMRGVGDALGTSEEAAKKRVARALEKLRILFKRRGLTLSAATLASSLTDYTVAAAPVGLAAGITSAALAGAAAFGGGASAILTLMSMSKLKIGAACALLVVGTTSTILQYRTNTKLNSEVNSLRGQTSEIQRMREENRRLTAIEVNADELQRLRGEHLELLQLRSQEGLPRAELAQPQTETIRRKPMGRAVVRSVRGTAQFSDDSGSWNGLPVGKVLGSTAKLRTGVDSQMDLFLGENGPTVRLMADTTLTLEKMDLDRTGPDVVVETRLDLKAGAIQGNMKSMAESFVYEVKTPHALCSIRGAEYQIGADGTIHIMKGSATVTYRDQTGTTHTRTLNAGETFILPASAARKPEP